jgi:hypothetical protein
MRAAGQAALRSEGQAPKLLEVRHFLNGFQDTAGTHRARRAFTSRRNGRAPPKYFARALDSSVSCQYNQELQVAAVQKKKGNMPFFIMLMPIKILIIWMFLQHLFGS